MLGAKSGDAPVEQNHIINVESIALLHDIKSYQRLVGSLLYLTITLSYVVSVVCQFMLTPRTRHLNFVYRILKYLKKSPGQGICFRRHGHLVVEAYTDVG